MRLKTVRDLLVSQIGRPVILSRYADNGRVDKNDQQIVRKCQDIALEQFLAYVYLRNSDKAKHGSVLNNLRSHLSTTNFLKSIADASNVLNNHKFDNLGRRVHEKKKGRQ
jgi:hypothetical protein